MNRERLTQRLAASSDRKRPTANRGELIRNTAGFDYDISKAKHLKKALHNINVSLGTLLAAMKEMSMLRGSDITPDGMLGGRGFIMAFKEIKQLLNEAVGNLSDVTDTLADELNNPKWGLSKEEMHQVKKDREEVEDKAEDVDDLAEGQSPQEDKEKVPGPEVVEEEAVVEETPAEASPMDEINPEDVVNSSEIEAIQRYQRLLEGNTKDKVASVLSKNILANLTQGE